MKIELGQGREVIAMQSIRFKIDEHLKRAEGASDGVRTSLLRLVATALRDKDNSARLAGNPDGISDVEIMDFLETMVRQRGKSAVEYDEHGQVDLANRERVELEVLQDLLPQKLQDNEVESVIKSAIRSTQATEIRHRGKVLSELRSKYLGQIDFVATGKAVDEFLLNGNEISR